MFRKVDAKSHIAITREWDALAPVRFQQITSGDDITYRQVLIPSLLALASGQAATIILDAGCGVGFLTDLLAKHFDKVIGVDPSRESIRIARANYGKQATFLETTLEAHSKQNPSTVDIVMANMVLMDVLNLDQFLEAARLVLRPQGALIFSTTHPWFWPSYYGYASENWFQYNRELVVEGPFKISAQSDCPLQSTHVHRPLEAYMKAFRSARFSIDILEEPMPPADVERLYAEPWKFPRYLVGVCRF